MNRTGEPLDAPFSIGNVSLANRLVLAPLAGIGNWFVRLQARRFGAGLVVSEMVSSFGICYGNERTLTQYLCIHPDEHPVAVQLFGHDPEVMAHAAEIAASAGADLIDINMGCPVRKVVKTGAGAALLSDPSRAIALARAAVKGSGLPVTVKLRSGTVSGRFEGFDLALRLAGEAGIDAICFHPRHAACAQKGRPDHDLTRKLKSQLSVPLIVSGGVDSALRARQIYAETSADAVMVARGSLGNPWIFSQALGLQTGNPTREEVAAELEWVFERAIEHFGYERAGRYLRKFYPWYARTLGLNKTEARPLVEAATIDEARSALAEIVGATLAVSDLIR